MSDLVQGLKLLFDTSRPTHEPQIMLQWCIMPETVERLRDLQIANPFLLIVVIDENGRENRELVKLDRMQKLVQFHRAGPHTIHAAIVWNTGGLRALSSHYLNRDNYSANARYEYYVWNGREEEGQWVPQLLLDARKAEREAQSQADNRLRKIEAGEATEDSLPAVVVPQASEVEIPEDQLKRRISEPLTNGLAFARREIMIQEGYFAKVPPAWERRWVNLWFSSPPMDQCDYRRRRIFAYGVQSWLMAIFFVFTTTVRVIITLWFILLGLRNIDYKRVVHPFTHTIEDVARQFRYSSMRSYFIHKADGSARKLPFYWGLFTPLVPVVTFPVVWFLVWLNGPEVSVNALNTVVAATAAIVVSPVLLIVSLIGTVVGIVIFTIVAYILEGFARIGESMSSGFKSWRRMKKRERRDRETARKRALTARRFAVDRFSRQYKPLVCDGRDQLRPVSAMPMSVTRTPVLLFEALKAKICRPYPK